MNLTWGLKSGDERVGIRRSPERTKSFTVEVYKSTSPGFNRKPKEKESIGFRSGEE